MTRTPDWIDLQVAPRRKKPRLWCAMTQAELTKALKISFPSLNLLLPVQRVVI